MYKSFYGFTEKPFHIVPNPQFLFMSQKHQNALTYLEYGLVERTGFVTLTGEIGTGKTTLIRYILDRMEPDMEVAVIFNTNVSSDQIINLILQEFEIEPLPGNKAKSLDLFYKFLIDRYARKKRVLLVIDEAQNLSREALEEIRMLSNLQSDEEMLLQIMLVGQPELRDKLRSPALTQFAQRIAVSYHLSPLTREETGSYIAHRLKKAGGDEHTFAEDAVDLIHQAAGGIPRTINLLCDAALVYGFADELKHIERPVIEQVIQDKGGMGLFLEEGGRDESSPLPAGESANSVLEKRVERLETGLAELRLQVEWKMEQLTDIADGYKDQVVHKLQRLLMMEKKRNDMLLIAYGKLKERLQGLKTSEKPSTEEDGNS
ncbi:MAG: XrtA/PEP-CTERM system-associated ATPase [Thermodesulfobacteriota bacterium]